MESAPPVASGVSSRLFQATAVSRQRAEENRRPTAAPGAKLPPTSAGASGAARSNKLVAAVFSAAAAAATPGPAAAPLAGNKRRHGADAASGEATEDALASEQPDAGVPRAVAAPPPLPSSGAEAGDAPAASVDCDGQKFDLARLEFASYRSFIGAAKRLIMNELLEKKVRRRLVPLRGLPPPPQIRWSPHPPVQNASEDSHVKLLWTKQAQLLYLEVRRGGGVCVWGGA